MRRPPVILVIILLAALIAGGYFLATRGDSPAPEPAAEDTPDTPSDLQAACDTERDEALREFTAEEPGSRPEAQTVKDVTAKFILAAANPAKPDASVAERRVALGYLNDWDDARMKTLEEKYDGDLMKAFGLAKPVKFTVGDPVVVPDGQTARVSVTFQEENSERRLGVVMTKLGNLWKVSGFLPHPCAPEETQAGEDTDQIRAEFKSFYGVDPGSSPSPTARLTPDAS